MQQVQPAGRYAAELPGWMSQDDIRAAIINNFQKFAPELTADQQKETRWKVLETSKAQTKHFAATALPQQNRCWPRK